MAPNLCSRHKLMAAVAMSSDFSLDTEYLADITRTQRIASSYSKLPFPTDPRLGQRAVFDWVLQPLSTAKTVAANMARLVMSIATSKSLSWVAAFRSWSLSQRGL
jgi:hypothetical protein